MVYSSLLDPEFSFALNHVGTCDIFTNSSNFFTVFELANGFFTAEIE